MIPSLEEVFDKHHIAPGGTRETLQHITTSLHNSGKSSSQHLLADLRESHGLRNFTDLNLMDYLRVLEEIGLVKFEVQTALYLLTKQGYSCYQ